MAFPLCGDLPFITRVIERVYGGARRVRAIAAALDVEGRRVAAALDAGEWLGVLTWDGEVELTARGLEVLIARKRRAAWAEVVRAHPFFQALGTIDPDRLLAATSAEDPLPGRARRQARALWRISRPARAPVPAVPRQITMSFPPPLPVARQIVDLRAGLDDNPDVYALLLRGLLDHGEVSPSQLRAILDRRGAERCGIGGYLAMAVRRGDARRLGDILIVTPGAIRRADLAESPVTVALSDPEFRVQLLAHLADQSALAPRFRAWAQRLFGTATVAAGLRRVLFDRPLASVPVAGDAGADPEPEACSFLDSQARTGLVVLVPSSLRLLRDGVGGVNRALRAAASNAVAEPTPVDRKLVVHGGLVHPGEQPPRAIPDGVSLRTRAVRNVPAFSLLAALGLLERRGALQIRGFAGDLSLTIGGWRGEPVSLTLLVQTLAHARSWSHTMGIGWAEASEIATAMGLLTRVKAGAPEAQNQDRITLHEAFFHRLQTDPEHRSLYEGLQPLADSLHARLG